MRQEVEDLFDDGTSERSPSERRFRLVSFEQLVDELRREVERYRFTTLIVNPRQSSTGEFTADAISHAEAFLRDLEVVGPT